MVRYSWLLSIGVIVTGYACGGCQATGRGPHAQPSPVHTHSHSHGASGDAGMHFYEPCSSDPDWLADAARFHGHLGPWVTVGAMLGRDALQRLDTRGYFDLTIICWMPVDKQKPPFTCVLDGLQVSAGTTMGKRNLRLADAGDDMGDGWPGFHVWCQPAPDQPARGFVYSLTDHLTEIMSRISPDRLELISRDIVGHDVQELFDIRPMTSDELAAGREQP